MLADFLLRPGNQSLSNEAEEMAVTASWSMFFSHLRLWLKGGSRIPATPVCDSFVLNARRPERWRKWKKERKVPTLRQSNRFFLTSLPTQKKTLKHQRKHKRLASEARPQPSSSITCTKTCINMSAFTFPSKGACFVHTVPVLLQTF